MFTTVPFGSIYGSAPYGMANTSVSAQERTNVNPNVVGGEGLKQIMEASGTFSQGVTGLSLPALIAIGIIAWWLFKVF